MAKQLYLFLTACGGNWRNSIYILCRDVQDSPGYLLTCDRDGQPVIMSVQQFSKLAGTIIDPAECCGQLTEACFETLYAQYLIWHCPSAGGHLLRQLCRESPASV